METHDQQLDEDGWPIRASRGTDDDGESQTNDYGDFVDYSTRQSRRKQTMTRRILQTEAYDTDDDTTDDQPHTNLTERLNVLHITMTDTSIKNVHALKLATWLHGVGGMPQIKTQYTRTGALRITCNCTQAARLLEHNGKTLNFHTTGQIHITQNKSLTQTSQGIVHGITPAYTEDEISEALSSQRVTAIRRFFKTEKGSNGKIPTNTLLLTFNCHNYPSNIKFGEHVLRVHEYIPLPTRCTRCQTYGHTHTICSRAPKCSKCGETHLSKDCKKDNTAIKCVNCGGPHKTGNKECTYTITAKAITHTAITNKISYAQALRQHNYTSNQINKQPVPIPQAKPLQSMPNPLRNVHSAATATDASASTAHTSMATTAITHAGLTNAAAAAATTNDKNCAVNTAAKGFAIDTLLSDINFVAMLTYTFHTLFTSPPAQNNIATTASTVRNVMLQFFPHVAIPPTPAILNTLPHDTETVSASLNAETHVNTASSQATPEPSGVNLSLPNITAVSSPITAPTTEGNTTSTTSVSATQDKQSKPISKSNNISPPEKTLQSKRKKKPVAKNAKPTNAPPIKPLTPCSS